MTHLDLSISPIAQHKKPRRSPLRLRFLYCTLEEISCAICITYFPTVPNQEITGDLAAHSLPNLFYILRKSYSQQERREFIRNLCDIFYISDLNVEKILSAADNEAFTDFEDCLQEECAVEIMADYIVTRNPADYKKSRVQIIQPDEFVKMI